MTKVRAMITVNIKISGRAKRWRLGVERGGAATLTVPRGFSQTTIDEILTRHNAWIERLITRQNFHTANARDMYDQHSGKIPFLGEWIAFDDHRKINDFYRREARKFFTQICGEYANILNTNFAKIRIGDQKSRYGSCSSKKTLSFSFRLVKAPLFAAQYIAAHECAHLKFMHHRAEFWACVARLCPDYLAAEKYLKSHGEFLRFDIEA